MDSTNLRSANPPKRVPLTQKYNISAREPTKGAGTQAKPQQTSVNKASRPLPHGITVSSEKLYIQVGVDFGTSSTKIAYQHITGRGRRIKALAFKHSLPHYLPCCIPSIASFDDRGKLLIGIEAAKYLANKPRTDGLKYLKLVIAGQHDSSFLDASVNDLFLENLTRVLPLSTGVTAEHIAVAFLASIFHDTRLRLQSEYPAQDLDLSFNVCAPIDHIQHHPLRSVFERIFAAAEFVESQLREGAQSTKLLELGATALGAENYPMSAERRVFLIPESVGAIASYLASLRAKDGIHAVYDLGAGTTDVSVFRIWNAGKGQPSTYWFAARNLPRGAQRIEHLVSHFVTNQDHNQTVSDANVANVMWRLNAQALLLREKVHEELREIWQDSRKVWQTAYGRLKKQTEWEKEKVQVFVCGGASALPAVKDIFCHSWMSGWGPYRIAELPGPDIYELGTNEAPFSRMCIAYGLTTPAPELGQYVLPDDCPDTTPEKNSTPIPAVYGSFDPDA